jgi:hypothetical protein
MLHFMSLVSDHIPPWAMGDKLMRELLWPSQLHVKSEDLNLSLLTSHYQCIPDDGHAACHFRYLLPVYLVFSHSEDL